MTKPDLPVEARLLAALKREMHAPPDEAVRKAVSARLSLVLGPSFGSPSLPGSEPMSLASSAANNIGAAAGAMAAGTATIHPLVVLLASATLSTGALFGISALVEPSLGPAAPIASHAPSAPTLPSPAARPGQRVTPERESTESSPASRLAPRAHSPQLAAASPPAGTVASRASLGAQQALLDTARRALARHDAAAALEALAWHRTQFPKTALEEEREALTVKALRDSGRTAEASERAQRFSERYPSSVFLPGVNPGLEPIP